MEKDWMDKEIENNEQREVAMIEFHCNNRIYIITCKTKKYGLYADKTNSEIVIKEKEKNE